ncbi:MAG: type 1 glutamine amidotransferase [Desulfuromonadaceae bacterium]|nr:type 1 glutamine amidotransferase [Desulfuromonadaceae bacterium]MDD2849811.1 type 1 glutamine amidotransferase [Desulfuromonadaceae bacterium]MDD4129333.1 type 1 glutamine amidotransferase [Desulfuromonadaceae bacterium]
MKVHILQHVPFENSGSMAMWLEGQSADVSYTRFFEVHALPQVKEFDLIIVMGGPMSVNDEESLSWLRPEKQFIRDAIEQNVSVLGVCLGAQLIASALGARVYRNSQKEIGWFQIEATPSATNTYHFPERCTVFHWHGETFDLPVNAVRLAKSVACENQAFQIGQHVIGLQFHLETTPDSAQAILDNCATELVPGPYVQTECEIREADSDTYMMINGLMGEVLSYLALNNPGTGVSKI